MNAELQARTKDTIEQLTDDKAVDLIEKKWIDTLILRLNEIPDTIIDSFVASISALKQKYETTYYDIEQQIRDT
jgi:type I restriction enzyme M protein